MSENYKLGAGQSIPLTNFRSRRTARPLRQAGLQDGGTDPHSRSRHLMIDMQRGPAPFIHGGY
jgi:hypothetical protein